MRGPLSQVAQVSLSMVLLLTAGLFLRTLVAFQSTDPGFASSHRLYVTALARRLWPHTTPVGWASGCWPRRDWRVA